jgi:hypothetical protein
MSLTNDFAHMHIYIYTSLREKENANIHYDGGPNNRELLLWIVRLIIVDTYLMLHNRNKLNHET